MQPGVGTQLCIRPWAITLVALSLAHEQKYPRFPYPAIAIRQLVKKLAAVLYV